jgi:carboxymethylenebutenolidase
MPAGALAAIDAAFAGIPDAEIQTYRGCWYAFARHTGTHFDPAVAAEANARTHAILRQRLGSRTT